LREFENFIKIIFNISLWFELSPDLDDLSNLSSYKKGKMALAFTKTSNKKNFLNLKVYHY